MLDNFDLNNLGGFLSEVQKRASEVQNEMAEKSFEAKSGGGMVVVKANGNSEIYDIVIDDSLLEDKESLQILLISAINELIKKLEEGKKEVATSMLGSLSSMLAKQNDE